MLATPRHAHSHLHRTIGATIGKGTVILLAVNILFWGSAYNALVTALFGEYSDFTRFYIYSTLAVVVLLLTSFFERTLRAAQDRLDRLEQRAIHDPDSVGLGAQLLLWGWGYPSPPGTVAPLPPDAAPLYTALSVVDEESNASAGGSAGAITPTAKVGAKASGAVSTTKQQQRSVTSTSASGGGDMVWGFP